MCIKSSFKRMGNFFIQFLINTDPLVDGYALQGGRGAEYRLELCRLGEHRNKSKVCPIISNKWGSYHVIYSKIHNLNINPENHEA